MCSERHKRRGGTLRVMRKCGSLLISGALLLVGCGSDEGLAPLEVPEGCNPLAAEHDCLLPFPSDFFLVEDSSGDGKRVSLPASAQPHTDEGQALDVLALHPTAGFSPGNQIIALFPQGIDTEALVDATTDPNESLGPSSPTVLIDVDSGKPVLHLAETDPRTSEDARRALLIRPLVRLRDGARYVVAIRGLRDKNKAVLPPPEGFRRLRDGQAQDDPTLASLASRYEADVFAPLQSAGVARGQLQLAWDFTVRSEQDAIGDMLSVRDQVIAFYEDEAPELKVSKVEDKPDAHTFRRVSATITVPLYMQDAEPLALVHRDSAGQVSQNGTVEVPFTVLIPESVAAQPNKPARVMQFGHGFFGDRSEIDHFVNKLANERRFVVIAADWWGMSGTDRLALLGLISDNMSEALRFTDRVHQAMANFIALGYAATGSLADLPELQLGQGPLLDVSELYFYGISQGGILGGSYLALSPHIERAVLSVGGANFSFMMFRARPFIAFLALIGLEVTDRLEQQKLAVLWQSSFDHIDPLSFAPRVEAQVLMQIGIGDSAVPNLASHLHARALQVSQLEPPARPISGLQTASGPLEGSAIVEFDFGIDPLPGLQAIPPTEDNEAHEGVRRLEAAKEQLDLFLRQGGMIQHTCTGVCDPE